MNAFDTYLPLAKKVQELLLFLHLHELMFYRKGDLYMCKCVVASDFASLTFARISSIKHPHRTTCRRRALEQPVPNFQLASSPSSNQS